MDSKFKDIAKMYDLKLNERFKLKENDKVIVHTFYFCESGLKVEGCKDYFDTYLAKLLAGTLEVVKLPFKPLFGVTYYIVDNTGAVYSVVWDDSVYYNALLYMGNVFHTEEEAEKHKDEIMSKFREVMSNE